MSRSRPMLSPPSDSNGQFDPPDELDLRGPEDE
jgi:hypothetical protein